MKPLKNHTKQSAKTLLVFGFTSWVAATTLFGQISFDEWGNATGIPKGFIGADPSGGIPPTVSPVLMYALPFGVIPGDVLINEPVGTNEIVRSDVVRFWNPTGGNSSLIIFYSGLPEAGEIPPPADVGFPSQLISPVGPFFEIGTEAFNYFDYLAGPGMPGSAFGAAGPITYHILSDGVIPEPSTCSLMVLGGGLLIGLKRRFQGNRQ